MQLHSLQHTANTRLPRLFQHQWLRQGPIKGQLVDAMLACEQWLLHRPEVQWLARCRACCGRRGSHNSSPRAKADLQMQSSCVDQDKRAE